MRDACAAQARSLGFDLFGVAPIDPELRTGFYRQWIADGQHGEMRWMERNNDRRLDPSRVQPEARSILVVGINYYQPEPDRRGRIAKYALGEDYHELLYKRLKQLCTWLRGQGGANRPYVDTGPVLEKPVAVSAGLGWQAKSTILLHPRLGTWLFLGEIFTSLEFPPDAPLKDRCGRCTACIDACPTDAITAPYQLDARRCIAYLTIEHPGPIPEEFREAIGDHLFGCDDCLDVCPWNRWARVTRESRFAAREYPDLRTMLGWDDATFREHFRKTPIVRLKRPRFLRNACVVLGNIGTPEDLPALRRAAADPEPLIAEHAAWAVARIERRYG